MRKDALFTYGSYVFGYGIVARSAAKVPLSKCAP